MPLFFRFLLSISQQGMHLVSRDSKATDVIRDEVQTLIDEVRHRSTARKKQ